MPVLDKLAFPGRVDDLPTPESRQAFSDAWQVLLRSSFEDLNTFEQLYDPSADETPADAQHHRVTWPAFPARRNRQATTSAGRAALAEDRDRQDEYCEWSVERDGDAIVGITFTSEVPEYWSELWKIDRQAVLDLYRRHVSPDVQLTELGGDGDYLPRNAWNTRVDGPIMHLIQGSNNLNAAIVLAGQATELRERNGVLITDQQDLVACGGLGDPFRASDPQIASAINGLAALGNRITLADPIGLYIDRLETAGMRFPDGVAAAECWTIERGTPDHAVRARFSVPAGRGTVGDVTIRGVPIAAGAQLADRVVVRIEAVSHSPGSVIPTRKGCG